MLRFWIIDLPAFLVTMLFRAYALTLIAMTLICYLSLLYSVLALWQSWPPIW